MDSPSDLSRNILCASQYAPLLSKILVPLTSHLALCFWGRVLRSLVPAIFSFYAVQRRFQSGGSIRQGYCKDILSFWKRREKNSVGAVQNRSPYLSSNAEVSSFTAEWASFNLSRFLWPDLFFWSLLTTGTGILLSGGFARVWLELDSDPKPLLISFLSSSESSYFLSKKELLYALFIRSLLLTPVLRSSHFAPILYSDSTLLNRRSWLEIRTLHFDYLTYSSNRLNEQGGISYENWKSRQYSLNLRLVLHFNLFLWEDGHALSIFW